MLLAVRMTLAIMIILCVVVQLVDGNQRIVDVSEPPSDNEEFFARANSDGDSNYVCSMSVWKLFL